MSTQNFIERLRQTQVSSRLWGSERYYFTIPTPGFPTWWKDFVQEMGMTGEEILQAIQELRKKNLGRSVPVVIVEEYPEVYRILDNRLRASNYN